MDVLVKTIHILYGNVDGCGSDPAPIATLATAKLPHGADSTGTVTLAAATASPHEGAHASFQPSACTRYRRKRNASTAHGCGSDAKSIAAHGCGSDSTSIAAHSTAKLPPGVDFTRPISLAATTASSREGSDLSTLPSTRSRYGRKRDLSTICRASTACPPAKRHCRDTGVERSTEEPLFTRFGAASYEHGDKTTSSRRTNSYHNAHPRAQLRPAIPMEYPLCIDVSDDDSTATIPEGTSAPCSQTPDAAHFRKAVNADSVHTVSDASPSCSNPAPAKSPEAPTPVTIGLRAPAVHTHNPRPPQAEALSIASNAAPSCSNQDAPVNHRSAARPETLTPIAMNLSPSTSPLHGPISPKARRSHTAFNVGPSCSHDDERIASTHTPTPGAIDLRAPTAPIASRLTPTPIAVDLRTSTGHPHSPVTPKAGSTLASNATNHELVASTTTPNAAAFNLTGDVISLRRTPPHNSDLHHGSSSVFPSSVTEEQTGIVRSMTRVNSAIIVARSDYEDACSQCKAAHSRGLAPDHLNFEPTLSASQQHSHLVREHQHQTLNRVRHTRFELQCLLDFVMRVRNHCDAMLSLVSNTI